MLDELVTVLNYMKNTDIIAACEEKKNWIKLTEMTEVNHNAISCRMVINIILTVDASNSASIFLYKDKFRIIRYIGIDLVNNTCKNFRNVSIRNGIESEEEFFQESTVADLNELEYDEYQVIQEIVSIMDKKIWSVIL